jgi:hypothetical protein
MARQYHAKKGIEGSAQATERFSETPGRTI